MANSGPNMAMRFYQNAQLSLMSSQQISYASQFCSQRSPSAGSEQPWYKPRAAHQGHTAQQPQAQIPQEAETWQIRDQTKPMQNLTETNPNPCKIHTLSIRNPNKIHSESIRNPTKPWRIYQIHIMIPAIGFQEFTIGMLTPPLKKYFTSSYPHHDIYTFCCWLNLLAFYLAYLLAFYLAFYLAYLYNMFWHSIWHIFWHTF